MRIAVDAMGGDSAPDVVIDGVADALAEYNDISSLVLVGDEERIKPLLKVHSLDQDPRITIEHSSQVVEMHESSTLALRGKKDSSITVCTNLAKKKSIDAIVSAGHTGAAVAASTLRMRTLPGIERAAIATVFPSPKGDFVLLDAGANVECKPENLKEFAIMGEIYAREILGISNPRVGLLSVGEEDIKGTPLTKATFPLLKELPINFIGNVEGHDLFAGTVDVVVCDGFTGNIVLKTCESIAKAISSMLKENLKRNPMRIAGAALAKGAFAELKESMDYAEYGGAPLLGVNGICIIGHGSSCRKAVKNAIRVAREFIQHEVNDKIIQRTKEVNQ